ncbi:MAG: hypothetical protein methR_P3890 [Methyloprofundus sp.]|nr:MAG: hypothetical protein methR_P3890 [Methyloprofundus sp.]
MNIFQQKRALQTRTLRFLSTLICTAFFSGAIFAAPSGAYGDNYWSASATTAVPETFKNKNSTSYTIMGTNYGNGVGSSAESNCVTGNIFNCEFGITRLFVPVTARYGDKFSSFWMRVYDETDYGHVTATLYRQYIGEQKATPLASISSSSQGFEIVSSTFYSNGYINPLSILRKYSYYIEIKIVKKQLEIVLGGGSNSSNSESLMVFDVGLGDLSGYKDDPCLYSNEHEYPGCLLMNGLGV